jgi:hypothetical protein
MRLCGLLGHRSAQLSHRCAMSFQCIYGGSYANLPLAQSLCDILMWLEKRLRITMDHFPKAFSANSLWVSCDMTNKGSPVSIINSLRQQLPIGFKKMQPKSSILIQSSSNGLGNHLLQFLVDSPSILTSYLFIAVEVCCLKVS